MKLVACDTGARRQDPHMVPHVVVPPTNLFSFIFLFLIYFAWKIYGNTNRFSDTSGSTDVYTYIYISRPGRVSIHQSTRTCQKTCLSVFPYIFQAKYIRNKKINENKLVGGTTTWGTIWGSCLRAPVHLRDLFDSQYLLFCHK